MANLDLKAIFKQMESHPDHKEAIDNAVEIAKLTIPTIAPDGNKIESRPYTNMGTQAVRSLSASITKSLFPPGANSFNLDLPPAGWEWLKANKGDQVEALRAKLDDRVNTITSALNQKTARSRFGSSVRRNLIEGTTAFVNYPDRIDVYPLRALVVERESGRVRILIVKDEVTPDPLSMNDDKQNKKDKTTETYTLFNFENGEVWRQTITEGEEADSVRIDDAKDPEDQINIRQAIVAVGEIPDVGDYPTGYAYNYHRLFAILDNTDASLGDAMSIASWNILRVKPGSPAASNPAGLRKLRSGDPVVADKDDIEWLPTGAKLGDFAFCAELRQLMSQEAAVAFAMGIKDRPVSGDTTATEIIQIIDELNTQTNDLLTSIEETLHRPLVESELYLQDLQNPLFGDLSKEEMEKLVRVVVTTGSNALDQQRQQKSFILQVIPMLKTLDPQLMVDGKKAADIFRDSMRLRGMEGVYSRMSDQQMMAMMAAQAGAGKTTPNGAPKREDVIKTRGGMQPPQPPQGAPPVGAQL